MAVKKSSSSYKKSSSSTSSRSSARKKTAVRRTSKRRSPKVKLDSGKVSLLAGLIFLVLCICIAVNVLSVSDTNVGPGTKTEIRQDNSLSLEHKLPPEKTPVQTQSKPKVKAPDNKNNSLSQVPKKSAPEIRKTSSSPVKPAESSKPALSPSKQDLVASAKGDKEKPSEAFNIPKAKNGATLVIIIDDAGKNVEYTKRYAKLPFPLTIAVLPKLEHTKECAYVVRSNKKELILHQPMQSLNHNLDPGPGKITVDMSFAQINSIIAENLAELGPEVKGLNNHEGSEVTEDVLRIGAVLDACQERGIYFLDSRTTANTQAPQAALERDMKIFEKSGPYIDNTVTRDAMQAEIYKALDLANKNGKVIIIGHVDKSANILPKLLSDMYPYLVKAGYKFATPGMLEQ